MLAPNCSLEIPSLVGGHRALAAGTERTLVEKVGKDGDEVREDDVNNSTHLWGGRCAQDCAKCC